MAGQRRRQHRHVIQRQMRHQVNAYMRGRAADRHRETGAVNAQRLDGCRLSRQAGTERERTLRADQPHRRRPWRRGQRQLPIKRDIGAIVSLRDHQMQRRRARHLLPRDRGDRRQRRHVQHHIRARRLRVEVERAVPIHARRPKRRRELQRRGIARAVQAERKVQRIMHARTGKVAKQTIRRFRHRQVQPDGFVIRGAPHMIRAAAIGGGRAQRHVARFVALRQVAQMRRPAHRQHRRLSGGRRASQRRAHTHSIHPQIINRDGEFRQVQTAGFLRRFPRHRRPQHIDLSRRQHRDMHPALQKLARPPAEFHIACLRPRAFGIDNRQMPQFQIRRKMAAEALHLHRSG